MSAINVGQAILLFLAIAVVLLSCLGLLVGDAFDRLHYLGPATVLAPFLLAGAVIISFASVAAIIKIVLLAAGLALTSPVLTHATGRSGFSRRYRKEEPTGGKQ